MTDQLRKLESTILELGTELFKLKQQVTTLSDQGRQVAQSLKGLQSILDEKGVISAEDFESAVNLNQQFKNTLSASGNELDDEHQARLLKKFSH